MAKEKANDYLDIIYIHYYRKKTDPSGKGQIGYIPLMLDNVSVADIFREYLSLLSDDGLGINSPLFHKASKAYYGFETSPIGKNNFDTISKMIAIDLNKENSNQYITHCYRRTGASILASMGASNEEIRVMGDWKSSDVATHYIRDSGMEREKIVKKTLAIPEETKNSRFDIGR